MDLLTENHTTCCSIRIGFERRKKGDVLDHRSLPLIDLEWLLNIYRTKYVVVKVWRKADEMGLRRR